MLLRLQVQQAGDSGGHLQIAVNRVQAIAAVHEVLAQEGYRLVNVRDVAERIVRVRGQHLTQPGLNVQLTVDGDAVLLPSRAATSLALVINELLENALEHAFVGRTDGTVRIHCGQVGSDYRIDVIDDGIGMAAEPGDSLGLEIVNALVHDDLHGSLTFESRTGGGTHASVQIPKPPQAELE
jgi:two-component sensor histidine kinase